MDNIDGDGGSNDNDDAHTESLVRSDLSCYGTVVRLNECLVSRDWQTYAALLSDYEIEQGMLQHERDTGDAEMTREKYVEEVLIPEMERDRGVSRV